MRTRARLLLCVPLLTPSPVQGQNCRDRATLIAENVRVPAYDHGLRDDVTLGDFFLNTYRADRMPSYIGILPQERAIVTHDQEAPLISGEGAAGYLFEANVDLLYPFVTGRNDPHFFGGGLRIGTYFNTTVRMTQDESHPLLPGNWKIGLAGEFPIAMSGFRSECQLRAPVTQALRQVRDTMARGELPDSVYNELKRAASNDVLESLRERNARVLEANAVRSHVWYASWQLLHYSNGQDTGFYADPQLLRNDYRTGDFSTNYAQLKVHYALRTAARDIWTVAAGYRGDFGVPGAIAFSPEQEHSYGTSRLLAHGQWRSHPFRPNLFGWRPRVGRPFVDPDDEKCRHRLRELIDLRARVELEHILDGDLSRYPHDQLYRTGVHLWLEMHTLRSHTTGFFVHYYQGRDYLNIRYDRVVAIFMAGVSFTFEKYQPFGWRSAEAIVE